jgi:hypothetical protein
MQRRLGNVDCADSQEKHSDEDEVTRMVVHVRKSARIRVTKAVPERFNPGPEKLRVFTKKG